MLEVIIVEKQIYLLKNFGGVLVIKKMRRANFVAVCGLKNRKHSPIHHNTKELGILEGIL